MGKTIRDHFQVTFYLEGTLDECTEAINQVCQEHLEIKCKELGISLEDVSDIKVSYAYDNDDPQMYDIYFYRPQTEEEKLIEERNKVKAMVNKQNKEKEEWELYKTLKKKFEGGTDV